MKGVPCPIDEIVIAQSWFLYKVSNNEHFDRKNIRPTYLFMI